MTAVRQAVADAHRREWARVLAATVRVTRDLDLAEECVQDAYAAALDAWARGGVPAKPGAWLTTAARRNALDVLRRARTLRSKLHLLVEPEAAAPEPPADPVVRDDRLRLVFLCCHPALAVEARVALTLRLVCGVPTPDIARAFLVSETTMAARITRAKKKIIAAGVPFRMPAPGELPGRLDAVLTVLHLLFTTGHTAPAGPALTRDDLAGHALDLAHTLHVLMPGEPEVTGLLALLLAGHARRATRTDEDGRLLLLEEQDRSAWDREAIAEAHELVVAALRAGVPGRFALQAAIAALHATAPTYGDTDWDQILVLYDALLEAWPSPVVALNRAVAVAMVSGPATALAEVEELEQDERLAGYHYLPAMKADLLRRLGRSADAAAAYARAIALAGNDAERAFLTARLAETGGAPDPS
ncbi:RNA polymerase sigma factor [Actinomadura rubrisoli]|uniref:Sigma-70 family RNA polymerase sigma factor n=1 Tax=Actinomadura rubrisoli TaxID=2530368 RepID=A0A4R5B6Z7_9ACTN|nr:sigma-70 family RNA polymerase sigma factor [Actinomadura rubrisoli]TDD80420.1 sigma-70 family RNA polymerase sigma factor [Actinomadura rubrisoli]